MKEYKYLYQKMLDENIIRKEYKKLRKGKTKRKEIIAIDANIDVEVAAMQKMIENTKPPDVPVENQELAYSHASGRQRSSLSTARKEKSSCRKYTNNGCIISSCLFWSRL